MRRRPARMGSDQTRLEHWKRFHTPRASGRRPAPVVGRARMGSESDSTRLEWFQTRRDLGTTTGACLPGLVRRGLGRQDAIGREGGRDAGDVDIGRTRIRCAGCGPRPGPGPGDGGNLHVPMKLHRNEGEDRRAVLTQLLSR